MRKDKSRHCLSPNGNFKNTAAYDGSISDTLISKRCRLAKKLITNANVFNGVDNNLKSRTYLFLLENNLITQIGEVDATLADEIIDAQVAQ